MFNFPKETSSRKPSFVAYATSLSARVWRRDLGSPVTVGVSSRHQATQYPLRWAQDPFLAATDLVQRTCELDCNDGSLEKTTAYMWGWVTSPRITVNMHPTEN